MRALFCRSAAAGLKFAAAVLDVVVAELTGDRSRAMVAALTAADPEFADYMARLGDLFVDAEVAS